MFPFLLFESIFDFFPLKLEDPGKLVQVGYSAEAHSKPCFYWVQNIPSKKVTQENTNKLDQDSVAAFLLAWTLFKKKLSPIIISDTEEWVEKSNIPRMTKEVLGKNSNISPIRIELLHDSFDLHGAE